MLFIVYSVVIQIIVTIRSSTTPSKVPTLVTIGDLSWCCCIRLAEIFLTILVVS
jgi:hypothetical protein